MFEACVGLGLVALLCGAWGWWSGREYDRVSRANAEASRALAVAQARCAAYRAIEAERANLAGW